MAETHRSPLPPKTPPAKPNRFFVVYVFAIVLAISIGFVVLLFLRGDASLSSEPLPDGQKEAAFFACDYAEAQSLYPMPEGLLRLSSEKLSFLSFSGTETAAVSVSMGNPKCVIAGDYAVIFDDGGFTYSVFKEKDFVYAQHSQGTIYSAQISVNGVCALLTDSPGSKGSVEVSDKSGNLISRWESVESGYPVGLALSADGRYLSISLLNTDAVVLQSYVKRFSIETKDGKMQMTKVGDHMLPDALAFPMIVQEGSTLYLSGPTAVVRIREDHAPEVVENIGQVFSVFPVGDTVGVVYSDGLGRDIRYATVDWGRLGLSENSVFLGNQLMDTDRVGGDLIVAADDSVLRIDLLSAVILDSREMSAELIRAGFTARQSVICVTHLGVEEIFV